MQRRRFIVAFGLAAITSPIRAYPQSGRVRQIGILMGPASDPETEEWLAAFRQKLRDLGLTEGGNVRIDLRWGTGDIDRIRTYASELVGAKPDVIVCFSVRVAKTLRDKTRDIPVVFIATSDPVGQGLVQSFNHPGGNLTGFTLYEFSVTEKLVQLVKEMAPGVTRVALLYNPENTSAKGYQRTLETVAPKFGVVLVPLAVRDAASIADAVGQFASEPRGALLLPPDVTTIVYRDQIITLAKRYGLPAVYSSRADVAAGGLMSYGPDLRGQFRGAATYVDRIFKGEKPADLPIQAPSEYALFINMKTARELGISVPGSIISRANEVIE